MTPGIPHLPHRVRPRLELTPGKELVVELTLTRNPAAGFAPPV